MNNSNILYRQLSLPRRHECAIPSAYNVRPRGPPLLYWQYVSHLLCHMMRLIAQIPTRINSIPQAGSQSHGLWHKPFHISQLFISNCADDDSRHRIWRPEPMLASLEIYPIGVCKIALSTTPYNCANSTKLQNFARQLRKQTGGTHSIDFCANDWCRLSKSRTFNIYGRYMFCILLCGCANLLSFL